MNYKLISRFLSMILLMEVIFMFPPLLISLHDGTMNGVIGFSASMGITFAAGLLLQFLCRGYRTSFGAREGMVCTGLSWILLSLFGALPFVISGEIPYFIDALFEIVSGFTTTGASILPEVEALSRGMLFWRSFSHWVGGMGVLVLMLAIIPSGKKGRGKGSGMSIHLLRAESPGPDVGKLVPTIRKTAVILYGMYFLLTILNIIFLLAGGMPLFDSLCTAFGTAGTGGFGIKNDSIAGYSPYIQNVCTVFMILFGVNFSCYYLLFARKFRDFFRDSELRVYFGIILGSIAVIAWNIHGMYDTLEETIRHAAFQVGSIITTTGFATTDFDLWPNLSKAILLCLMVVGACAGSTGGGLKCSRLILLFKSMRRSVHEVLHPNQVCRIRYNGRSVDESVMKNLNNYLVAYVAIIGASYLILSFDGFSSTTNFSAVLACFNNIGPGLDLVGPTCNYSMFSLIPKLVLIFDMLAGRLEIYAILLLFTKSTWRRH